MRSMHPGREQSGFTFAELAFGMLVFVIGAVVLINHLSVNYSSTKAQSDRVFAFTKAQAILAEVQAYVDRGEAAAAIDLDALDDGVTNKAPLTISEESGALVPADHPLSGNHQRDGQWLWSRRITVQPFTGLNNRNVRYVTVRIYKRDMNGVEHQLANLSSVVNSVGSAYPTTQTFDIYLIALENIPGWWVYMDAIQPFVESTISDLKSRNPGLDVRTHWITKTSYGRNRMYRPYLNETASSWTNIPKVYFYPALMPNGSASTYYYVPGLLKAHMLYDGVDTHGFDTDLNPYPYVLADQFNHAMRYPQEQAFHQQRVDNVIARRLAIADAKRNSTTPPPELDDMSEEPTYRLLLEDMCTNPNKYRRAMLINLHGELLPMPSLRNYSDAAKDPEDLPNVRVVAHAEELRTKRDPIVSGVIDPVKVRVYAYSSTGQTPACGETMPVNRPIAVRIMGVDLTRPGGGLIPGVTIENLRGGVDIGGVKDYMAFAPSKQVGDPISGREMYYEASFPAVPAGQERFTLLKLYQTPLVAPYVEDSTTPGNWRGLNANKRSRLYGLEYVPAPCEVATDFSRNLNSLGDGPKNTARWVITIPREVFDSSRFVDVNGAYSNPNADVTLTIRTSIWDDSLADDKNLAFGTVYPAPYKPDNFSETYTWWSDSNTDVPFTERAQFQGDPRHLPYKDMLNTGALDFLDGYNWFWDALSSGTENARPDFPALANWKLYNRWMGRLRQDLPRFMQILRTGLVETGAVYTTLTGFSYYYAGFGNEIGYDAANNYPSSIPVNLRPFGAPGVNSYLNTITGSRMLVRSVSLIPGHTSYWMGMPWLGELYPDTAFNSQWLTTGNLPAGNAAGEFLQRSESSVYTASGFTAYGTLLGGSIQCSSTEGCTSFFNIGASGATFHHQFRDGQTGTLVGAGLDLANNYNFPMPTTTMISRPFGLANSISGTVGTEWNSFPYNAERGSAVLLKQYYNHQVAGQTGSGLVQLFNTAGSKSAFVIVNGLDKTVESGSAFIAKFSMLSLVQSFFEGGNAALAAPHRIQLPPRVSIASPTDITELTNPATIDIKAQVDWLRWDGQKYTSGTASSFSENESEIDYVVMYSRDGGTSWLQIEDDSVATPGVKPSLPLYVHADAVAGNETFTWSVPAASFPEGSYLLRVEAYRQNQSLHYSQHQVKIFISR